MGKVDLIHRQVSRTALAQGICSRYFSFDAVTAISLGQPIGFLDSGTDVRGLIGHMDHSMYLQKLSLHPTVAWFARSNALGRWLFVSQRTDSKGLGKFMAASVSLTPNRC